MVMGVLVEKPRNGQHLSSNPACGRARPLSWVKIALRHSPVKPNAAPAAEEEIVDLYRL